MAGAPTRQSALNTWITSREAAVAGAHARRPGCYRQCSAQRTRAKARQPHQQDGADQRGRNRSAPDAATPNHFHQAASDVQGGFIERLRQRRPRQANTEPDHSHNQGARDGADENQPRAGLNERKPNQRAHGRANHETKERGALASSQLNCTSYFEPSSDLPIGPDDMRPATPLHWPTRHAWRRFPSQRPVQPFPWRVPLATPVSGSYDDPYQSFKVCQGRSPCPDTCFQPHDRYG